MTLNLDFCLFNFWLVLNLKTINNLAQDCAIGDYSISFNFIQSCPSLFRATPCDPEDGLRRCVLGNIARILQWNSCFSTAFCRRSLAQTPESESWSCDPSCVTGLPDLSRHLPHDILQNPGMPRKPNSTLQAQYIYDKKTKMNEITLPERETTIETDVYLCRYHEKSI